MKVGDVIKLSRGPYNHFKLSSYIVLLIEKLPRSDAHEYDWLVLADGHLIELGRQIEGSAEVLNESR
jgi:hypothetical protein